MHESLLKGKVFSSRFWGWGRNRSLSPPLPRKASVQGRCPPALRPEHTGDRQAEGRGWHRALPISSASHTVFPSRPPALNTKHSQPYRDISLVSRHAERLSGSTARPSRSWPPTVPVPTAAGPGGHRHFACQPSPHPHPLPPLSAPGQGPYLLSRLCGTLGGAGDTGPRSCARARRQAPWGTLGQPGQGRGRLEGSLRRDSGGAVLAAFSPTAVSILLHGARGRTPFSLLKLRSLLRAKAGTPGPTTPVPTSCQAPRCPGGPGGSIRPDGLGWHPWGISAVWVSLPQRGAVL